MKREIFYKGRRPSRINMFLEWVFLVAVICLVAVLVSKIWLRAAGQDDASTLSFISSAPTVTGARIDVLDSSATAAARLRSSQVPAEISTVVVNEITPTPIMIGSSPSGGFGSVLIGQSVPDFTLPTLEGGLITLSELHGQPILINLWASWCPPCRLEMPLLITVYQRYQGEGLVILGLNVTEQDSLEAVNAFVEEFDVPFPVLLDEAGHVSNDAYGMIGLPMSVFVDRNGTVKRVVLGALVSNEVDGYIAEIMSQGE